MKKELELVCWTGHILNVIEKAKTACSCSCWKRFSLDDKADSYVECSV